MLIVDTPAPAQKARKQISYTRYYQCRNEILVALKEIADHYNLSLTSVSDPEAEIVMKTRSSWLGVKIDPIIANTVANKIKLHDGHDIGIILTNE